jgi:CheY-like chemotaxis protein
MGGEIGVQSTPGIGSTFWFIVALPAAEAPTRNEKVERASTSDMRPLRILVVEDVDVNQEIARSFLESAGHRVDVADNGAAAIAAVQANPYDVVLMDIQMPVMDGMAATKAIRALPGDVARISILAMTANVLPQQVESFRMAGMNGHVAKPLRRDDLLAKVAQCRQPAGAADAAVEVAAGALPVLDHATFDEIFALLGHAKAALMLGKLRDQLGVSFARDANAKPDAVAREAHKLISMAGTFGFLALSESCAALEEVATEGGDIAALLDTVRKECGAALATIATHMAASRNLEQKSA